MNCIQGPRQRGVSRLWRARWYTYSFFFLVVVIIFIMVVITRCGVPREAVIPRYGVYLREMGWPLFFLSGGAWSSCYHVEINPSPTERGGWHEEFMWPWLPRSTPAGGTKLVELLPPPDCLSAPGQVLVWSKLVLPGKRGPWVRCTTSTLSDTEEGETLSLSSASS